jgi:hypothetical protein
MIFIVKQVTGQFLKRYASKDPVIFVILRELNIKKKILLECPTYTHIRCQFQNICYNTNLPNFLTRQNYSDLGIPLLNIFKHRNKILKQTK